MVIEVISQNGDFCPECGGSAIAIQERGEMVCQHCGLVIAEKEVDVSHSGIRAYSKLDRDKKERSGSPISILMADIGLSTIIDRTKIKNPDLKRAAKWNKHLTWEKRNILIAITELKRVGGNLNFPEHVKKAAVRLYKQAFRRNLLRGRSISGMIAACAYYICKLEKVPITLQDIIAEISISGNIVKKCYRILLRELNLKSPQIDPVAYIPKFCSDLGLNIEVEKEAIRILKGFNGSVLICGKDPKGLCAGAIYFAVKLKGKKISQKNISNVIGVTEVTLRSRYKEFLQNVKFQFS